MWELWIHNIIKEKEACDIKQFISYWLPLNTEINLLAVLIMWELWIQNIIKENEVWDTWNSSQVNDYHWKLK